MSKARTIKFTAVVVKWFDRINSNMYHSVRITRHRDAKVLACPFTYGHGSAYEQTTLQAMVDAKWLPPKYRDEESRNTETGARLHRHNYWTYQRENNDPILFTVSDGLKRDCLANGTA